MSGENYEAFEYKDISELKKELEGIRGKKDVSNKELYEAVQKLAQVMGSIVEVFGAAAEQMNLEEKELESSAKKHEMIMAKLDKVISQNKTIAEGMLSVADIVRGNLAAHTKHTKEEDGEDSTSLLLKQNDEQEPNFFKPLAQQDWQPKPAQAINRAEQMTPHGMPAMPRQADLNEMRMPYSPGISNIPPGRFERSENVSRVQQTMVPPIMPPITLPSPVTPDFGMQMPPMEPAPPPNFDLDLDEALSSMEHEPKKKGLFGMFKK